MEWWAFALRLLCMLTLPGISHISYFQLLEIDSNARGYHIEAPPDPPHITNTSPILSTSPLAVAPPPPNATDSILDTREPATATTGVQYALKFLLRDVQNHSIFLVLLCLFWYTGILDLARRMVMRAEHVKALETMYIALDDKKCDLWRRLKDQKNQKVMFFRNQEIRDLQDANDARDQIIEDLRQKCSNQYSEDRARVDMSNRTLRARNATLAEQNIVLQSTIDGRGHVQAVADALGLQPDTSGRYDLEDAARLIRDLQETSSKKDDQIKMLSTQDESSGKSIETLIEQKESKDKELERITKYSETLIEQKKSSDKELERITKHSETLIEQNKSKDKELERITKHSETLIEQKKSSDKELARITKQFTTLESALQSTESDSKTVKNARVEELANREANVVAETDRVNGDVSLRDEQILALKKKGETMESELAAARRTAHEIEERLAKQEDQSNESKTDIKRRYEMKIKDQDNKYQQNLDNQEVQFQKTQASTQEELDRVRGQLLELHSQFQQLDAERKNLNGRNQDLQSTIQLREAQIDAVATSLGLQPGHRKLEHIQEHYMTLSARHKSLVHLAQGIGSRLRVTNAKGDFDPWNIMSSFNEHMDALASMISGSREDACSAPVDNDSMVDDIDQDDGRGGCLGLQPTPHGVVDQRDGARGSVPRTDSDDHSAPDYGSIAPADAPRGGNSDQSADGGDHKAEEHQDDDMPDIPALDEATSIGTSIIEYRRDPILEKTAEPAPTFSPAFASCTDTVTNDAVGKSTPPLVVITSSGLRLPPMRTSVTSGAVSKDTPPPASTQPGLRQPPMVTTATSGTVSKSTPPPPSIKPDLRFAPVATTSSNDKESEYKPQAKKRSYGDKNDSTNISTSEKTPPSLTRKQLDEKLKQRGENLKLRRERIKQRNEGKIGYYELNADHQAEFRNMIFLSCPPDIAAIIVGDNDKVNVDEISMLPSQIQAQLQKFVTDALESQMEEELRAGLEDASQSEDDAPPTTPEPVIEPQSLQSTSSTALHPDETQRADTAPQGQPLTVEERLELDRKMGGTVRAQRNELRNSIPGWKYVGDAKPSTEDMDQVPPAVQALLLTALRNMKSLRGGRSRRGK